MEREDLEYINKFSKITIALACRYFGYNQSNLRSGKCGKVAERNVRKFIEKELSKIYLEESNNYVKEDSTL